MEILFELIFGIIFEGAIEGIKMKKLPIWIRIICAVFVILIFLFVIAIIGIIAILMWKEENYLLSILFFATDLILIIFTIRKLKLQE